jgi:hypothetical protein
MDLNRFNKTLMILPQKSLALPSFLLHYKYCTPKLKIAQGGQLSVVFGGGVLVC